MNLSKESIAPATAPAAAIAPSPRLYTPHSNVLQAVTASPCPHARAALDRRARDTEAAIGQLITQKNFPCIAALKSFHADDYQVGFYGEMGKGERWRDFRSDLLYFLQEQKRSSSIYLTFWAVFQPSSLDETNFEHAMWNELSFLTSEESRAKDWESEETSDPASREFRFSLNGAEFFVVGLHPQSSRLGRRFPFPALVFNVFAQFDELERKGQYDPMVALNRARDLRFQGSVNPMVAEYGEKWEAIQFSGKNNGPEWKCPFQFMKEADKP